MTAIRISLSFKVAPVIKSSGRFKAWTRKIDQRRKRQRRVVADNFRAVPSLRLNKQMQRLRRYKRFRKVRGIR